MKRLLIADDDAGMRAALEARFERRGWQVDVAVNGSEALTKFRQGLHPLVITDVRMPGRHWRSGNRRTRYAQRRRSGTVERRYRQGVRRAHRRASQL
jgi:CheY-like chemotaxis protein